MDIQTQTLYCMQDGVCVCACVCVCVKYEATSTEMSRTLPFPHPWQDAALAVGLANPREKYQIAISCMASNSGQITRN